MKMNRGANETPSTLQNWEDTLVPQVRAVELLGEIPISAEECAQLGQGIGKLTKRRSHTFALRVLEHEYPCSFAVYLVAQGIHGYQDGDYWSKVVKSTGLNRGYTWQIGQTFEAVLEKLRLPLFYDMRADKAHRYISLILAHGGIPTYCLPDFFENVLQPAVVRTEYADMSAAEVIEEIRWRARTQYFTDKPVLRFLVHGAQVAEGFLDRCREMTREVLDTGIAPDASEAGLPERVIDAYRAWIEKQDVEQMRRTTGDRWRLRKPEMLVDPWGEGVLFDFPPQQLPATMIYAEMAWQMTVGNEVTSIPVHARRSGFDWRTSSEAIRLSQPAETYQVAFVVNNEVKRTWHFQGVSEACPLLAFDADRGTALTWQHSLPARRLGLIYPRDCELTLEASSADEHITPIEELPRMPGGWAAYRGQIWDAEKASRLVLRKNGAEVLTAIFRPDETAQRPYLVGGELLSTEGAGVRGSVYIGSPPSIRIPLAGRGTVEEELARWRVTAYSKWAAIPEVQVIQTLTELRSQLALGQGYVDLPLNLPSLLGDTPMGNYDVRLRGPLGRDAEFTLRCIPHLVICEYETLYLPDPENGPEPAVLLVETDPRDAIECRGHAQMGGRGDAERESIVCSTHLAEKTPHGWEYEVEVEPEVVELEMTVVRPRPEGDAVRAPILLPIRRLRWAFVEEQTGAISRAWGGKTIRKPLETLLQAQSPELLVALPVEETQPLTMTLHLLDVDNAELMVRQANKPLRGRWLWRVDLSAFLDTVRASLSPVLRLELRIQGLPGTARPSRWPALSLVKSLIVENVHVHSQIQADYLALSIRWDEPAPLRYRRLRMWPLWQPWRPVYELRIPDDVTGELAFSAPIDALPPGGYRLEFVVVDPWSAADVPQRPQEDAPGTADVALTLPTERQNWLTMRMEQTGKRFPRLLERAHIRYELGDTRGSREDCQRCFEQLDDGTVPQILALCDLLSTLGDQYNLRALELKMYAAERVKRFLHAHAQGSLPWNISRRIWPTSPVQRYCLRQRARCCYP
jgi:RNA polymerase primary sigma factor